MLSRVVLAAIAFYQRHLSPRKGFSCAYRVAHGGPGCSGYAKQQIALNGVFAAWPDVRARFDACKVTALEMRQDQENTRKRSKGGKCTFVGDCLTSGCSPSPCGAKPKPSSGGCDGTPDCTPDCCSL